MTRIVKALFLFAIMGLTFCCATKIQKPKKATVEVQGHRGDRGNFPENTIPAFLSAVKKGADVIELDVVISKHQKVVVSHENFMSAQYMSDFEGKPISKDKEHTYNLYEMNYDSIKKFDSGSRGNSGFPAQQKMKTYKPLLAEMIDSVENYIARNKFRPVRYNIEIKSEKEDYGKRQPKPEQFCDMVMKVIKSKNIEDKINIQSFDPTILNVMHKNYPRTKIAFLTGEGTLRKNLSKLDFTPEIYSPNFKLLNKETVDSIRILKMKIIPWTVNEEKDINRMMELQVDGIITDYPERVLKKL